MFWIAVGASILSKMVSANLIVILRYLRYLYQPIRRV